MPDALKLIVNGSTVRVQGAKERSLLSVLRDDLDLTGAKYGCGEGQCGACTVLVDGIATRACITDAKDVVGRQVTTIEGLMQDGRLHPVRNGFLEEDAMQCGYCTSGMIMSSVALLKALPNPTAEQIVKSMQGNICRCGTYPRIVAAIQKAAGTGKEIGR